ncbi:MAG: type II secretion system F family protein [Planctomycetota bacterium]
MLPPLKGKLKKGFKGIYESVNQGESIFEGMAKYPGVFAPLDVSIVKAADTSGNLPPLLMMLSQWYEFRTRMKRIMISGLMLPLFIIHIAAIFPPGIFLIAGQMTYRIFCISVFSVLSIFYIPAFVILFICKFTPKRGFLRRILDEFLRFIPLLGKALLYLALSRYCRSFNMLYAAGVPITKCAEIATESTGNLAVVRLVEGSITSTQRGKSISEGFSKRLPSEFLALWETGEVSGALDHVTKKMADFTSDKAEFMLTEIIRWIPRLVYFLVVVVIALLILSQLGKIFSSYSGMLEF